MNAIQSQVRSLGAFLRRLREERELTQKQVASELGISQSALSAWESGQTLPPRPQIERLAAVLGVGVEAIESYFEKAETEESFRPHSSARVRFQGAEHVKRYGAENFTIWILGATNLQAVQGSSVPDSWRANLLQGIDYNVIWFLDLVPEENFRAAIAAFAESERRMAVDLKAQRAARTPGAFSHYATNGFDPPSDAMIALYNQFEESLGGAGRTASAPVKSRVHPYVAATMCGSGAATPAAAAVTAAVKKLLRCWHPETGIVLYRPKTVTTPPAANIRLMPVAEHIVEGLAPEAEQSQYWFWLSPRGAARVNTAVTAVEAAMVAAERQE